jgi:hypothetical protein
MKEREFVFKEKNHAELNANKLSLDRLLGGGSLQFFLRSPKKRDS